MRKHKNIKERTQLLLDDLLTGVKWSEATRKVGYWYFEKELEPMIKKHLKQVYYTTQLKHRISDLQNKGLSKAVVRNKTIYYKKKVIEYEEMLDGVFE